jgi:hypothetical protein
MALNNESGLGGCSIKQAITAGRRGGAQWAEIAGVSEEEVRAELTFANESFS